MIVWFLVYVFYDSLLVRQVIIIAKSSRDFWISSTLSVYAFDVDACWHKNLPFLQVHDSTTGQIFKSQLQTKHVELLQSPWLVELIAFHLNLIDNMKSDSEIASRCVCDFEGPRPTLSFLLSDAIKLEVALTCSVCLVSYSITCINSLSLSKKPWEQHFNSELNLL